MLGTSRLENKCFLLDLVVIVWK
ncbi:unnamed protein product [Staurois parvus]|uniref:Uncharacterized protein n=1 Tax=Staurois parvus TaxID=386267 RepID=A0ABN9G6J9_9NEOB|nr:unnamed protein product [Staurois parvus]